MWIDPSCQKYISRQKLFGEIVGEDVMCFQAVIDSKLRIKKMKQVIIICGSDILEQIKISFEKEIKTGKIYHIICYKESNSYKKQANS